MRLWRISRYPGLDGTGGTFADSRWHHKPRRILFAAEHPALAMIEVLAHLQIDIASMPTTLRLIAIDVKSRASTSPAFELPPGWQANEPTTQAIGDAWLDAADALLVPVPSAILPHACNYLINPRHRHAASHLSETDAGPFWVDPRFAR